jgi:hypothetical protein
VGADAIQAPFSSNERGNQKTATLAWLVNNPAALSFTETLLFT